MQKRLGLAEGEEIPVKKKIQKMRAHPPKNIYKRVFLKSNRVERLTHRVIVREEYFKTGKLPPKPKRKKPVRKPRTKRRKSRVVKKKIVRRNRL